VKGILLTGQSNAWGEGTGGTASGLCSSKVKVWNNVNPLSGGGTAFITPNLANQPFHSGFNNLGLWFADRMARTYDEETRMLLLARGSTPVSWWTDPSNTSQMLYGVIAVWGFSGLAPADVALWHQGEADGGTSKAAYKAAFLTYDDELRSNNILGADAPHIVGGVQAWYSQHIDEGLRELAEENAHIHYAPIDGLPVESDGIHFTGGALCTLGRIRYWNEMP
jgi:hypothetical protein